MVIKHVDPVKLARELNLLRPGETVRSWEEEEAAEVEARKEAEAYL